MPYQVYKASNDINDKLYIGCTVTCVEVRWNTHRLTYQANHDDKCLGLHSAMREYGWEHFSVELIEDCKDQKTMRLRERFWIHAYNSLTPHGYNISARKLTDEQIAIVKFNAYSFTRKEYAKLFGVSASLVGYIQSGYYPNYGYDPHAYITEKHLPKDIEAYMRQFRS